MGWRGKRVFSQNYEDGIIEYLFGVIAPAYKYFVEIGANRSGGPIQCNTYYLRQQGWAGPIIDGNPDEEFLHKFITRENIVPFFRQLGVPRFLDFFSLDIDGNDYWVLEAFMKHFQPAVVCCEYNPHFQDNRIVPYDENFRWGSAEVGSIDFYGASLKAFVDLMAEHEYTLVHSNVVNAFFVRNILLPNKDDFKYEDVATFAQYHLPAPAEFSNRWIIVE